jgi:RND family efflux transporter MFP subunit
VKNFKLRASSCSLLIVSMLLALASAQATDAPSFEAKPALTVSMVQATSVVLPIRLSANGAVAAWQEAQIGAEVTGLRVAEIHANVGDKVLRGQLLATFATETVQADVALARANLAEVQALAAESATNAERARTLQGTGALSQQQIDQYSTQEQTAKARLASAKAQLDAQLLRLKQTQLVSPDNGTISSRTATVGAVISSGTEMFRLIRRGRMEWRGEVTAAELERIRPGIKVVLTSAGGVQWRGQVRMLSPTVDPTTRKGLVYVDLLGPVEGAAAAGVAFKPGVYVRGVFEIGSSAALTIPQSAVIVREGFSYVYRINSDGRVSQLKVQTGRRAGDRLEVMTGVQQGDRLVASGASFLTEGDLVRVVAAPVSAVTK